MTQDGSQVKEGEQKEWHLVYIPYKQLAFSYYMYTLYGLRDGQGCVCEREREVCVREREKDGENERKYFYTNKVVAQSLCGLPAVI